MEQPRCAEHRLIPMSELDDNHEFNCRGKITILDVEHLAKDISVNGLLQPIVVRPMINGNFKYRVVAGFSRTMAMKLLRWKEVPCVIRECDDEYAAFMNLSENLIRKDLNFMQEARAVQQIGCKFPRLNDEMIGQRLGQNRNWVQVRLFALNMPEEVQDVIAKGFVTYDQIKYIHKMRTKEDQLIAIRKIKEARERGLKVKISRTQPLKPLGQNSRSRGDIFLMQDHIVKSLKTNNFGTRCLAWAAGEITDFELFGDIANIADNEEIPYVRPKRLYASTIEEIRGE